MEIRKMALALPLAFGIACSTSQSQRTARTAEPAPTPPPAGTAATREGSPGAAGSDAEGGAVATTSPGTMGGSSDIKGHDSDQVLMGKVSTVSTSSLSIQSDMGDSKTLAVVPETIVTVNGRDGHISDLQEGQEVRASYNEQEGRQVAVKIEAGTTGAASSTTTSDMGTGSTGTTTPPPAGTGATREGSPGAAGSDAEGGVMGTTSPGQTGTGAGDDGTLSGDRTMGGSSDIKGHDSDQVLMGRVANISTSSLSIESHTGDSKTLRVVPETIVTVDGRDGKISDLKEGQEVRASFNEQEGKQVAVKIEAGRPMGDHGHMGK